MLGYWPSHSSVQFSQYQPRMARKGISFPFSMGVTSCQGNKCPAARKPQGDWIHAKKPGLQTSSVLALGTEPRNGAG